MKKIKNKRTGADTVEKTSLEKKRDYQEEVRKKENIRLADSSSAQAEKKDSDSFIFAVILFGSITLAGIALILKMLGLF